jgi:WD40 repeat protein
VQSAAFSPDGTMIVSGSADATIRLWHSVSGTEILQIQADDTGISSVVFSPDGHWIVSGSLDCTVRVWDVTTGTQVFAGLHGHTMGVGELFFSPDASCIISQSECETISWDAATGHLSEQSNHSLVDSMYITHNGWVVDVETGRTLSKLPNVAAHSKYVVHEVIGSRDTQWACIYITDSAYFVDKPRYTHQRGDKGII